MRSRAAFQHQDRNAAGIIAEIRKRGVEVEEIFQPLDLLAWLPNKFWGLVEIKMPGSQAKWTRKQIEFISRTRLPVTIVTNADEAMLFLKTGEGLTQAGKDSLAAFLIKNSEKKFFTPAEIQKVLG